MQNPIADQCPLPKRSEARRAAKLELKKNTKEMKALAVTVKRKAGRFPSILLILNKGDLSAKAPTLTWFVGSNLPSPDGKAPQSFRKLQSLLDFHNPENLFIKNAENMSILDEFFSNVEQLNKQAKAAFKTCRMLRPKRRNTQ